MNLLKIQVFLCVNFSDWGSIVFIRYSKLLCFPKKVLVIIFIAWLVYLELRGVC